MAYDIIGDVHGQAGKLKALLRRLGYAARNGTWRHSDPLRTAVFVGDYIDRGPEQVETIEIVRGMVDKGTARAIMGNHELNAIAWVTERRGGKPGEYLRADKAGKRPQHQAFLDAVGEGSDKLACLDYAAAVGDRPLMAYRWDGEKILGKTGFVGSH